VLPAAPLSSSARKATAEAPQARHSNGTTEEQVTHELLLAAPLSSSGRAGSGDGTSTSLPSVLDWISRCT